MSVLSRIRTIVLGRELSASEAASEQITPVEGLSALSLDALTSVAYGPEAILVVLAAAGAGALHLIAADHHRHHRAAGHPGVLVPAGDRRLPAAAAAPTRCPATTSGHRSSQLAAAALIVDYTLTVAVSIAAGVGPLTSAFPSLTPYTVPICLGDPGRRHRAQPPRPRRERPGVPAADPGVHRRAARRSSSSASSTRSAPHAPPARRAPWSPPTRSRRSASSSC